MAIATINDVKLKLGVETLTAFEEEQVQFYLDSTLPLITSMFGDFELSNKIEYFNTCDFKVLYTINPNPIEVIKIDDTNYTGVLGTDYMIEGKKLIINDLFNYVDNEFGKIKIEYSSGYTDIPKDIIYFHCLLVEGELAKQDGKEVKKEQLGPRSVEYIDSSLNNSIIDNIKNKYLIITI